MNVERSGSSLNSEEVHKIENIIEAALLTTSTPLSVNDLLFISGPQVNKDRLYDILNQLKSRWNDRALVLTKTTSGWCFKILSDAIDCIPHLIENKNPKYSKAVLETLAIIAYKQPVTRTDIESIRGVSVSSAILQTLNARNWIKIMGYKDALGKPALWGTTEQFLIDFELASLKNLPSLDELKNNIIEREL